MADHRIGKTYVEVDMDYTPYTRAQKRLYKDATQVSLNIEKNFKNLGIRSAKEFDLMRAKITNSYNMIAKSGKASTEDRVRAEKAMVQKLKRINEQQYGHTTTMLDRLKKHWQAYSVGATAALYAINRFVQKSLEEFKKYETALIDMAKVTDQSFGVIDASIKELDSSLGDSVALMKGYYQVISAGVTDPKAAMDLLTTAAKVSKAAHLEQSEVIKALTKVMKGFEGEIRSTEEAADLLFTTERWGQTTVAELVPIIGDIAKASKVAGVSHTEMAAALALITQTAGGTSEAATQYRGVLLGLLRPNEKLTALVKQYGFETGIAMVETLGFSDTLKLIKDGAADANVQIGKLFRSSEGMLGLASLSADDFEEYNELIKRMGEGAGSSAEAFDRFLESAQAVDEELEANFKKLLIEIGEYIEPFAKKIKEELSDAFDSLAESIRKTNQKQEFWENWVEENITYMSQWIEITTESGEKLLILKENVDAYYTSIKKDTEIIEDASVAEAKRLAAAKKLAEELKNTNKDLEKHWKILQKHKTAIDQVALAAMPKYERALESIRRKYDELNKALDKHGALAGKTTEEIAELHKNLYGRMMDEVGSFAESFAKDVRGTVEETEKTTADIDELWTNAIDRVQSTMADTFVDFFKGELKTVADYFKAFCDILFRYWAEMLAKMVMQSKVLQGITSGLGGMFGGGGLFGFGGGGGGGSSGGMFSGWSPMSWASIGSSIYNIGKQIGAGITSVLGFGGSSATANWSMVGGFPTADIGTTGSTFGASQLGKWIKIGGQLYLAYSAYSSFSEEDYAGGAVHTAAAGAAYYGGPWGWAGAALAELGLFVKKMFFGSNLKRSYLTREYTYGYDLDGGWSETGMEETKEKRYGEKFRKSAEEMSSVIVDMLNQIDTAVSGFLESIDKTWADKFRVAMIELGSLDFVFDISAEDKKEFREDWRKSFSAALEGIINPVLETATEFMSEAFTEGIESSRLQAAKGILKDNVQSFLDDSIASVYEAFSAELPTTYEEFETYMENLGAGMTEATNVLEYLGAIADIMDQISLVIELHGESDALKGAIQSLIDINTQFRTFAEELSAVGVDLAKYPELLQAWHIAITESVESMSSAGMSGEDLAKAIQYMADEMEAAGHSIEEVADAVHAATMGIMESINEIYKRHNEFGKTFAEVMSEKYDFDFTGWGFEDWAAVNQQMYEDFLAQYETGIQDWADYWTSMGWTTEMLQDWRNFGAYLEDIWEQAVNSGEAFAVSVGNAGRDFADMIRQAGAGLGSGATEEVVEMQRGAIVTRPTYSLIGEAGYPEVVLPLGGGHKLKAQMEGGESQEVTITIPLTVITEDGKTLKQETITETFNQLMERSRRREHVIHAAGVK